MSTESSSKNSPKTDSKWWAKAAMTVLHDQRLSDGCKLVFWELAGWTAKNQSRVSRGVRSIAKAVGMHKETVGFHLQELAAAGHIRIEGKGNQRRTYILLGPVYRRTFYGSAAGEVVEFRDDGHVIHKRIVKTRKP